MIPISLKLSGFLSYRDPVEVDFTGFDLACISGSNGAGKSSLLDAVTWALFGQARKRDDSLINLQSSAAEVAFVFSLENNLYRVQRSSPRGKTTLLEFQILDGGTWRTLSERTGRETQARIEQTLRLDYETFTNAAFFLQGKADQFTQQRPGDRKRILGSILGLEAWEDYRKRTAERRAALEAQVRGIDGRMAEIEAELAEEPARLDNLSRLESALDLLSATRKSAESALEGMRRAAASLGEQRKLVAALRSQLDRAQANLSALESRLEERQAESLTYADLLGRGKEIEAAYKSWQSARDGLARWDGLAGQFSQAEKRRSPLAEAIAVEKARLEQEGASLRGQYSGISEQLSVRGELHEQLEAAQQSLAEIEARLAEREALEKESQSAREKQAELKAENLALKAQMDEIKARIERLEVAKGATCPLCGQGLSPEHRQTTITQLNAEGKSLGDRFRANQTAMADFNQQITEHVTRSTQYASLDRDLLTTSNKIAQLTAQLDALHKSAAEWEAKGGPRLKEIEESLADGSFAAEARAQLAAVDAELKSLGYDPEAHDAARQAEAEQRAAEEEYRNLEKARAALAPLEREIKELKLQVEGQKSQVEEQQKEYDDLAAALAASESQAPDLATAERELFAVKEQENRLNQEVGAARQKVSVLDDLRARRTGLESGREALGIQIGRHKTLERAFGKDGVPALLIEQALPEIETKANEILDRLSNGSMSVRFATQAEYKDKKRDDLKETLDIQISDGAGLRDYEMYSGGEAFRVNFAIRLALSKVLAQRKGARLQTLVIDEGFGSQDEQGRQRLIEAINLVKGDFAKILVITHLNELKDAFPNRIEVEKTGRGSVVRVI
ncbi:MAG: AAA family ATPase [Chloroflexota bacterium]